MIPENYRETQEDTRKRKGTFEIIRKSDFSDDLMHRLLNISTEALGNSEERKKRFPERFKTFDFVIVVREKNNIVGYGGYEAFDVVSTDTKPLKILYRSSTMVKPENQGSGYGTQLGKIALRIVNPDYVVSRTQNPASAYAMIKSLPEGSDVAPFTIPYAGEYSSILEQVNVKLWKSTLETSYSSTEEKTQYTGVVRGTYESGGFSTLPVNSTERPRLAQIVEKFNELKIDPKNGDAVVLVGKVNKLGPTRR